MSITPSTDAQQHQSEDTTMDAPLPLSALGMTERQLYRIPDAILLLSMSRSMLYEQIRAGRLRSVTQGRTRLIPATAIREYVALLMSEAEVSGCAQSA